jgi:transposase-like protein
VDEQRVRFVVSASRREKTVRALCAEFEISRPTGYEWLRRYRRGGIAGSVKHVLELDTGVPVPQKSAAMTKLAHDRIAAGCGSGVVRGHSSNTKCL